MRIGFRRFIATWKHRKSPFQVLDCKEGASPKELKQKFYSLSQELHPDKTISDEKQERDLKTEKYLLIQEAYSLLKERPHYRHSMDGDFNITRNSASGYPRGPNRHRPFDDSFYESTSPNYTSPFKPREDDLLDNWQVWFFGTTFIIFVYYFAASSHIRTRQNGLDLAYQMHEERLKKAGLEQLKEND